MYTNPFSILDFGSHRELLQTPYLTVAAALGVHRPEIDKFFVILDKCWTQFKKTSA